VPIQSAVEFSVVLQLPYDARVSGLRRLGLLPGPEWTAGREQQAAKENDSGWSHLHGVSPLGAKTSEITCRKPFSVSEHFWRCRPKTRKTKHLESGDSSPHLDLRVTVVRRGALPAFKES